MMNDFKQLNLPVPLTRALDTMHFTTPTPIQAQAIPPALTGRDILGTAQTGTGKTVAFSIPLITNLLSNPRATALILTPTRELATQIMVALKQLTQNSSLYTVLLIGGEPLRKQIGLLKNRPRIIVGTPGRINDHLERGTLMLHNVNFLVLDETDRMLDMGFSVQLDRIAKFLTGKRQTLMFSATLPKNILRIAEKYLRDPLRVSVGSVSSPVEKIEQKHLVVSENEKYPSLLKELDEREGSIIVFTRTKFGAEKLAKKLSRENLSADALHGDLRQNKRDQVVRAFRNQRYRILVATDIAARGLDIPHIEHVINYDLPQCPDDYIHRIGRTARAGANGSAMSLLTPSDRSKWNAICNFLNPDKKKNSEQGHQNRRPTTTFRRNKSRPRRRSRPAAA
ncbi:MAG: DEAD/DEAH box helicase [Bdellovibrionales bacterium]|nr:DEAD/DEAH box helicase [Bdellovibrionales bacterium]